MLQGKKMEAPSIPFRGIQMKNKNEQYTNRYLRIFVTIYRMQIMMSLKNITKVVNRFNK